MIVQSASRFNHPYGMRSRSCDLPGVETPGYCQASLREARALTRAGGRMHPPPHELGHSILTSG